MQSQDRNLSLLTLAAAIGAVLCVALMGARILSAISFSEALQLQASGDEFSNTFVIWRVTQGLPVYVDPMSPPYYHPVYNWLFYYFYGIVTKMALAALSLGDEWLPTIGRYISLAGMLISVIACHSGFMKASSADSRTLRILCLSFSIYVAAGPLIGFFNLTQRADIWALTLEIIASALFLHLNTRRRWLALLVLMGIAYLAWSFKQGNVFSLGATGLFLLFRQDYKRLAVLVTIIPGAWVATFFLASPLYAENILFMNIPTSFTVQHMFRNLTNFFIKSSPGLLPLAAIGMLILTRKFDLRKALQRDAFAFSLGGVICSALLSIPASSQTGGAENYFFVLSFFIALFVISCLPDIRTMSVAPLRFFNAAGLFGWASFSASIILVFAGVVGVINIRPQHAYLNAAKQCLDTLPRPVFVNEAYLMLPWMTPGNPSYTISYTYAIERKLGKSFENGGFGGLIADQKFASLALTRNAPEAPQAFDGAPLTGYKLVPSNLVPEQRCSDYYVFFRHAPTQ